MLIKDQADPGRVDAVRFLQGCGGVHLVFRAFEEYATVAQRYRDTAHLRVLEAFLVIGVVGHLA